MIPVLGCGPLAFNPSPRKPRRRFGPQATAAVAILSTILAAFAAAQILTLLLF